MTGTEQLDEVELMLFAMAFEIFGTGPEGASPCIWRPSRRSDSVLGMTHPHEPPPFDAAEWDAMYAEQDTIWSGAPNAQLVAEVSALSPGTALDVGCGEGADAVWLAQQGWDVTAVDISEVALERARAHAASAGLEIAFEHTDLVADPPAPGAYDLVSAQFFHLPEPPRDQAYQGLSAAVSPGGHLLIVGHYPSEHIGKDHPERFFTTDEIIALFSADDWHVVASEVRERTAMHHGELSDLVDGVVLLRRAG